VNTSIGRLQHSGSILKSYGLNMAISTLFFSQNMTTLCRFFNSILFCHQVAKFRPKKEEEEEEASMGAM